MMPPTRMQLTAWTIAAVMTVGSAPVQSAGFVFAGEGNGVNLITHPKGYTGAGGNLVITVGVDPTSVNAAQMVVPTQNVIRTLNALEVTTGNLQSANVPFSQWDFETVLLHEMGHAMGLSHCNLATESGLPSADREYTKSTDGNGGYDLNAGGDGLRGSRDDLRGDDENLNWYRKGVNDPGAALPAIVDSTTYGRGTLALPAGHTYIANGERSAMAALGHANTESIMQQGTPNGRAQRTMTAEDVGALRMGMSGLDRTQGTSDDYTFTLVYAGLTTNADIVIDFDNSRTGFATTYNTGQFLNSTHMRLTGNPIGVYFNSGAVPWFFNQESNEQQVEPGDPDNVFVDFGAPENGTGAESYPFDNMTDAIAFANNGATININPGSSAEIFPGSFAITKPVMIVNTHPGGGSVEVGN